MKGFYLTVLSLLPALLFTGSALAGRGPALAEHPVDDLQASNVRQLLITNECAGCDLTGVDLSGAHLIGADLRSADLTGADLSGINLEGADLTKANLTDANLTGAFLTNATLARADLDNANFTQAHLYYVDVTGASMENINLAEATVIGTPISIGGPEEPLEEPPFVVPEDIWRLNPPSGPDMLPNNLIDVPPEIVPEV